MKNSFKKLGLTSMLLVSLGALVACGTSGSKDSKAPISENSDVKISVKSGSYVLPPDGSSDDKYLALEIQIQNKSKKKLTISRSDFGLYDKDDEKTAPVSVYQDGFKDLSSASVSAGKKVSGYLVFEVDGKSKYELQYSQSYNENAKEITMKVDSSKYSNDFEKLTKMTESYISQVFLNGEDAIGTDANSVSTNGATATIQPLADDTKSSSSSKGKSKDKEKSKKEDKDKNFQLANKIEEEQKNFSNVFKEEFEDEFNYYEPSDQEVKTVLAAYIKENAKRAKITYSVKSYLPGYAEVYVRPEVVNLNSIDASSVTRQFAEENKGNFTSYKDLYKSAEKFYLEKIPSVLGNTNLSVSKYMNDKEGFLLKLTKNKDDKWEIDTSDYRYEYIVKTFTGML